VFTPAFFFANMHGARCAEPGYCQRIAHGYGALQVLWLRRVPEVIQTMVRPCGRDKMPLMAQEMCGVSSWLERERATRVASALLRWKGERLSCLPLLRCRR